MHPLVELAKKTIELYVRDGKTIAAADDTLPQDLTQQAGVFVSLKIRGMLRGCIGTFQPTQPTIAHEVVQNAISAATADPRFSPVRPEELGQLEYSVDVLSAPEPVSSTKELDPKKYGVIVQSGRRRGLLLPDLEGVDTVDYQVSIAMQKAGIPSGSQIQLSRFEVKRYH